MRVIYWFYSWRSLSSLHLELKQLLIKTFIYTLLVAGSTKLLKYIKGVHLVGFNTEATNRKYTLSPMYLAQTKSKRTPSITLLRTHVSFLIPYEKNLSRMSLKGASQLKVSIFLQYVSILGSACYFFQEENHPEQTQLKDTHWFGKLPKPLISKGHTSPSNSCLRSCVFSSHILTEYFCLLNSFDSTCFVNSYGVPTMF